MADILPDDLDLRLNAWLEQEEPALQELLKSLWADMSLSVSPSSASQMISVGEIPDDLADAWASSYEDFIETTLSRKWAGGMSAGVSEMPVTYWQFLTTDNIQEFLDERGPQLLSGLTRGQSKSVNQIIKYFASEAPVSANTLASIIKPAVGMTPTQSGVLLKHYEALQEAGASAETIRASIAAMGSKLQAQRAAVISRTELAAAYNGGIDKAIRGALEDEAFDADIIKRWRTQEDERVCSICGPLDNEEISMDENFKSGSFSGPIPPAHPQCRCVVLYQEV